MGEKVGVTKANVSHWETGKHDPSFLQLLNIRDLTGYPLREVVQETDWPFTKIPRERITRLRPEAIKQLQTGLVGILAAIDDDERAELSEIRPPMKRKGAG